MRSSRLLLSLAKEAPTIPPRGSWDIIKSSAKACFKLISTQNREECLRLLNSGVINPNVLGIPMSLALYDEISSPLWDDHRNDVENFTEGAKMALQQFHHVHLELINQYLAKAVETEKDEPEAEEEERTPAEERKRLNKMLRDSVTAFDQDKDKILSEHQWTKDAESDPDCLAAQLKAMVTPRHFDFLLFGSAGLMLAAKANQLVTKKQVTLPGKANITNIALLSARAQVVPPTPAPKEDLDKMNEADTEKNDDILNNIYTDQLPILAHIEVLYEMDFDILNLPNLQGEAEEKKGQQQPEKQSQLDVAVFEGWLNGSPDGKPLRWKIENRRPPWEFI